jgi:hypothetical protein
MTFFPSPLYVVNPGDDQRYPTELRVIRAAGNATGTGDAYLTAVEPPHDRHVFLGSLLIGADINHSAALRFVIVEAWLADRQAPTQNAGTIWGISGSAAVGVAPDGHVTWAGTSTGFASYRFNANVRGLLIPPGQILRVRVLLSGTPATSFIVTTQAQVLFAAQGSILR